MSRAQNLGALALAAGVMVALTGCSEGSNDDAVLPLATPTSSATSTASPALTSSCMDFAASPYIGAELNKANDVKPMGWSILLWDKANSPSWEYGAGTTWTIGGVEKDRTTCLARFEVVGRATSTPSPAVPPPAPPPAPAGPLTTVSDGTYLVGTDMVAGSYKSPGPEDSRLGCYWARNKDDAGDKIIANDYTKGPARFTAKKGEFVSITNCTFTKI